ncbi:MAG: hypothetical protein ACSLE1_17750 [Sphingobium sp.]
MPTWILEEPWRTTNDRYGTSMFLLSSGTDRQLFAQLLDVLSVRGQAAILIHQPITGQSDIRPVL